MLCGGLGGLTVIIVSYVLQFPTPPPPQLSDMPMVIQNWYNRGQMVNILGKQMFYVSVGKIYFIFTFVAKHLEWTTSFDLFNPIIFT